MRQLINKMEMEHIYVLFILFFGTVLCFLRPPYLVDDEVFHFARAWQVSEGMYISPILTKADILDETNHAVREYVKVVGVDEVPDCMMIAEVPSSMMPTDFVRAALETDPRTYSLERMVSFLEEPLDISKKELFAIPNTGQYFPLMYAPQAFAAYIGRSIELPSGMLFYLMRLSSLFFSTVCIFISMRILPRKKFLIFLLAITPLFLQQAASMSADAIVNGCCFFGVSKFLSWSESSEQLKTKDFLFLGLFSLILGFLKPVYGLILFLYWLLPCYRIGSTFKFWAIGIVLLLLNSVVSSAWLQLAVYSRGLEVWTAGAAVDVVAQKEFIFGNPLEYITILFHSILEESAARIRTFIDPMNDIMAFVYVPLLFLAAFTGGLHLNFGRRVFMLGVAFFTVLGIYTVEYLMWTPVSAQIIQGVQSRYFIPIALVFFCSFACLTEFRYEKTVAVVMGFLSMISTAWRMYDMWWFPI